MMTNQTRKRMLQMLSKPERAAYLFISPALIILLVFTVVPLLATLAISTLRLDIFLKGATFVGLEQFEKLLSDDRFWNALKNTVYFTAVEVPLQIVLSLLAAVYVAKNTRFRKLLRSAYFLPYICSFTAIGIVWSFLLDPQTGLYPHYLHELGLPQLEFLRDPDLAMPSIVLMSLWRNFGYTTIILVAGLQSIPDSYYEAAELDGAGKVKKLLHISVPMLMPALGFSFVITTIQALQVFDPIFVTTQGGPLNRTETVVLYIYNTGFKSAPFDLGYASAVSVVLLVLVMAATLTMNAYFNRKESSL